jgi:hypothetical protein
MMISKMSFYNLKIEKLTRKFPLGVIYKNSIFILCFIWLIFGFILGTKDYFVREIIIEVPVEVHVEKEIVQPVIIEKIKPKYALNEEMKIISQYIRECNPTIPKSVSDVIAFEVYNQSEQNNVKYELMLGIMKVESHFNPTSKNTSSGAAGLMQVLSGGPGILIDKEIIFNIDYNIEKGIEIYLEHLRLSRGDVNKALYGYVGGNNDYITKVKIAMSDFLMYKETSETHTYEIINE